MQWIIIVYSYSTHLDVSKMRWNFHVESPKNRNIDPSQNQWSPIYDISAILTSIQARFVYPKPFSWIVYGICSYTIIYIYIYIYIYILYNSVPRFTHHFEVSIFKDRCRVKFGRSIWFVWNLLHVGVTSNHSGLVEDVEFHLLSSEFDSNSLKHTASVANKELIHWQKKQHPFFHRYFNVQRTRAGGLSAQQGGMFQIPHNCRFHGLAVPHTSTARRVRKVASKDSLFVIFQVSFWCRSHPDVYFYSGKVT